MQLAVRNSNDDVYTSSEVSRSIFSTQSCEDLKFKYWNKLRPDFCQSLLLKVCGIFSLDYIKRK